MTSQGLFDQLASPLLHIMPDCAHPVKRRAEPPKDEGDGKQAGRPNRVGSSVTHTPR